MSTNTLQRAARVEAIPAELQEEGLEPRLARAHDGNVAERTHSQQIAQNCCLKVQGGWAVPASLHFDSALLPNVFRREKD